MGLYRHLARPLLFHLDPERAHRWTIAGIGAVGRRPWLRNSFTRFSRFDDARLRTSMGGVDVPSPVGLAAGCDKNGTAVEGFSAMGFGFLEVGSVSEGPSEGNRQRPRLWRLPADEATAVYYGVPNDGAAAVSGRLSRVARPIPVGVNLVETNTGEQSSVSAVIGELVRAAGRFVGVADHLVLNLNCPNTAGGESPFDAPESLRALLEGLAAHESLPPVFLKVAATTDPDRIDRTLQTAEPFQQVRGIVFNLPPGNPFGALRTPPSVLSQVRGSISGPPSHRLLRETVGAWYRRIDPRRFDLVGAGGIRSPADAYAMIRLGASTVQVYTALVYHGPGLVKAINRGLSDLLRRDSLGSVQEAVGVDAARPHAVGSAG